ncbi:MAG: hypothetical protein ACRC4N_16080 [Gammaproteobacteria bacterium]
MPKIKMNVKYLKTGFISPEVYEIDANENPEEWAKDVIDNFNSTLRVGESPRELVSVEVLDEDEHSEKHNWEKKNFVTVVKRGQFPHDVYQCKKCGITGKRFGFDDGVSRDYRYRNPKFEKCSG